jgi:hypothetical protein
VTFSGADDFAELPIFSNRIITRNKRNDNNSSKLEEKLGAGNLAEHPALTTPVSENRDSLSHFDPNTSISGNNGKTLSILFPAGLLGGYRNQVMRFIGLLKHALDNNFDNVLLPTLVWSTRYSNTGDKQRAKRMKLNPVVKTWPIPFDELFDVDHWNTFQQSSLPRLVSSVVDGNHGPDESLDHTVCWKPQTNDSIVSVAAVQHNNPNFTKSYLPLLTRRMLFGNDGEDDDNDFAKRNAGLPPPRKPFILDPIQAESVEFLTGSELAKYIHKVDLSQSVENCTHPHVFGGKSRVLWNAFLQIAGARVRRKKKMYTKLIEKVDEALVPAKPWRVLADRCVEHHLGLGDDEFLQEEEDPHAVGHDHGYIALHSRVEPEMLSHKCGREMERNLTTILDLVELLALDYNSPEGLPATTRAKELNYASPISDHLRHQVHNSTTTKTRPLKGAFVAVSREELGDLEWFPKMANLTENNLDVLNKRSISYDDKGSQLYSKTLAEREQNQRRMLAEEKNEDTSTPESNEPLPIFECGEGWVKHAFYESEARQKKLFTPPSSQSQSSSATKDYGLYHKYGAHPPGASTFPLLPLPDNYFGDLLPSMLNFWLAVRADVFVGVQKSSWSTDVWTTRYYMGKGDRNFEYTSDRGILAIGDGGLPKPHKNC